MRLASRDIQHWFRDVSCADPTTGTDALRGKTGDRSGPRRDVKYALARPKLHLIEQQLCPRFKKPWYEILFIGLWNRRVRKLESGRIRHRRLLNFGGCREVTPALAQKLGDSLEPALRLHLKAWRLGAFIDCSWRVMPKTAHRRLLLLGRLLECNEVCCQNVAQRSYTCRKSSSADCYVIGIVRSTEPRDSDHMGPYEHKLLKFDRFIVDLDAAQIRASDGGVVPVEPQVFDLVVLLSSNPGRLISHDEIIEKVWRGRIVTDSAIASRINAARKALGDDGTAQRVIKTIRGRGFRFELTPLVR